MGYMTEISIYNDNFSMLEKDPAAFVRSIRDNMSAGTDSGYAQATILPAHHADDTQVLYSGGNVFMNFDSPKPFAGTFNVAKVRADIIFKIGLLDEAECLLTVKRETLLKHLLQLEGNDESCV